MLILPTLSPTPTTSVPTREPTDEPTDEPTNPPPQPTQPPEQPGPTTTPVPAAPDVVVTNPPPPAPPPTAPPEVAQSTGTICGDIIETGGLPTIDMSTCLPDTSRVEREAWTPITIGEGICVDWLVYHTDMTGDWEIFRLGELPNGVEADPNLSRGVGRRVYDLMPSRAPDQKWVAFTSNRDGNWEIYLSAVERPLIQRVTYNTWAIDLDPAWSPSGGRIAYESNRSGEWQLYLFDVSSGEEIPLTRSEGNNVNAFWSYDGTKIVFQSDREGFWQIYEIDVNTRQERLLSDGIGDDHDPQYSYDDQHILFRSMRDGDNSVIYMMNEDGTEVTSISDTEGHALNQSWSPDDSLIAYESDVDGDEDVYVYEVATGQTRHLTDNALEDYAPTWYCIAPVLVFTSDVTGDSDLFSTSALPVNGPSIDVEAEASQLTTSEDSDEYPLDSPSEENASREESFPSPIKNK
jgi:Tol biopolymer transport system component